MLTASAFLTLRVRNPKGNPNPPFNVILLGLLISGSNPLLYNASKNWNQIWREFLPLKKTRHRFTDFNCVWNHQIICQSRVWLSSGLSDVCEFLIMTGPVIIYKIRESPLLPAWVFLNFCDTGIINIVVFRWPAVQALTAQGIHRWSNVESVQEVYGMGLRTGSLITLRHKLHRHRPKELCDGDSHLSEWHSG